MFINKNKWKNKSIFLAVFFLLVLFLNSCSDESELTKTNKKENKSIIQVQENNNNSINWEDLKEFERIAKKQAEKNKKIKKEFEARQRGVELKLLRDSDLSNSKMNKDVLNILSKIQFTPVSEEYEKKIIGLVTIKVEQLLESIKKNKKTEPKDKKILNEYSKQFKNNLRKASDKINFLNNAVISLWTYSKLINSKEATGKYKENSYEKKENDLYSYLIRKVTWKKEKFLDKKKFKELKDIILEEEKGTNQEKTKKRGDGLEQKKELLKECGLEWKEKEPASIRVYNKRKLIFDDKSGLLFIQDNKKFKINGKEIKSKFIDKCYKINKYEILNIPYFISNEQEIVIKKSFIDGILKKIVKNRLKWESIINYLLTKAVERSGIQINIDSDSIFRIKEILEEVLKEEMNIVL